MYSSAFFDRRCEWSQIAVVHVSIDHARACGNWIEVNVIRPLLQRAPHFVGVFGAIIDTSDPTFMSADVIEHCLDDVGLYAKLGHLRCSGAPKVMQAPGLRDVQALV